ncbi:diguanylate cyclase [Sulfuricella sp. T08]|uniref:GGDEF domain-containing protein n=1 Tax=Sulfuricella sp. T08 TaxID=1632857 RepID=UPI0006179F02|nr:GGDEF domain-containing protein [Sulfuricella sp. T08]GAO36036.1 diguanylate cyclase [Sulfuricella sp. T08]
MLIPSWAMGLHAIAIAVLDEEGGVVEFNQGFLSVAAEAKTEGAGVRLAKPDRAELSRAEVRLDGKAYSGPIVLAGLSDGWGALSGSIYRTGSGWLLAAEVGISAFPQLNGVIDRLGRELEDTERTLARRNQALQKALEEVETLKRQDTLTGLANRRSLDDRIAEEIGRWERYRRPLGLILMEMDDFGGVNENYGREVGDELLHHVATVITHSVRTTDLAARYGGLEFAMLLPETNEMGALIVAERLRMELEGQFILPMTRPLTASFGVAMLLPGESRQELYARAGRAVGYSKKNGGNCVTMAGVISECDQLYGVAPQSTQGTGKNV